MPASRPTLTRRQLADHVADHVFGTASCGGVADEEARRSVGIELEWLTGYRCATERLRVDQAAASYPYAKEYGLWPGPNSNTFTAWLTRHVPEVGVDLPGVARRLTRCPGSRCGFRC